MNNTSAETPEEGKHTPGPWKLGDDYHIYGPDREIIAMITRWNGESVNEQRANAELITRAPSLERENAELNEAIAHVWKALGVTEYTGKHISEHVAEQAETIKRYKSALEEINSLKADSGLPEHLHRLIQAMKTAAKSALSGTNE